MTTEKSIFEIRRHSRLSAIVITMFLSILSVLYLSTSPISDFEAIVAPSSLGGAVDMWQIAHPLWAAIFMWVGISYLAIRVGQLVFRYDLYGTKSYLSIELFPLFIVGLMVNAASLRGVIVTTLVAYSLVRHLSSYRNSNSAGILLSSSIALGLATLLYPSAIVLYAITPFVLIIFERTMREVIVGSVSLLIVPLGYIYILWVSGADFGAELNRFVELIVTHSGYSTWESLSVVSMAAGGIVLCLAINSVLTLSLLENTIKARRRLQIVVVYMVAIGVMFAMPSSDSLAFMIMAVPLSILIPVTLLTFGRKISFIIYVLLFGCAAVNMWLG